MIQNLGKEMYDTKFSSNRGEFCVFLVNKDDNSVICEVVSCIWVDNILLILIISSEGNSKIGDLLHRP